MKSFQVYYRVILSVVLFGVVLNSQAQSLFAGLDNLPVTALNYVVQHTNTPPKIDGDINDAVWAKAKWTNDFQDIEGDEKPAPAYKTRVKMLWDDSCLYIAATMAEPNVWAYETRHDAPLYDWNNFEVFLNPDNTIHNYYEIEFNPLNTVFDLFMERSYRDGGSAMINWNAEGMRSAVKIQGTINNPADVDTGWTIEIAIPFKSISIGDRNHIPKSGELWRINFSRVEWNTDIKNGKYVRQTTANGKLKPEHNWVWSAPGLISMHFPERWGYLQFSKDGNDDIFTMPYAELQKKYLWQIYYRERVYFDQHHTYSAQLMDLRMDDIVKISGVSNKLILETTEHQFMAMITDERDKIIWCIDQQGVVKQMADIN